MTITTEPLPESEVADEHPVAGAQASTARRGGAEQDELAEDEGGETRPPSPRLAVAVGFPVVASGIMVGGVFEGASPRVYCVVAGILGVVLAAAIARLRKPLVANLAVVVGLFAIGLLMVVPGGADDVARVGTLAREAAREGDLLRPPVPYDQGWHAITGWLMGIIGFVATWVAVALRRPSIALLIPLPFAALAGISVPDSQQVGSGLAVLVLFAIGLGLLSSEQSVGEGDDRPPLGYEVRKALRALPLLAVIVAALYALAQTDFLFPPALIDPAKEPQEPKTVPITEVEDRELFQVTSTISGPWRMGTLDVYQPSDGTWRLAPFAENELEDVPSSGVVNPRFQQGVRADFVVRGLGGAVLPGLPNTVGILATDLDSTLQYDGRSGNIRLADGQVEPGLEYTVVAAALPSIDELQRVSGEVPEELEQFVEMPDPPPAVTELLTRATTEFDNQWDRFDFLRLHILENVVATGVGTPIPITVERVQEVLGETLEASPYEIVALQAMLARWAGVPARIGYGFDGGEVVEGNTLSIRPRNGASFPEVWFPSFGWLPVIGTPKQAEPSVGGDPETQQVDPAVLPSDEVGVELFLPVLIPPGSVAAEQLAVILAVVMPVALLLLLAYVLFPGVRKARLRARRRAAAMRAGPRARVALAYAEWRDFAADFGFRQPTDTPLMFLERFVEDEEHMELAWLTTRCLWGDLRDDVDDDIARAAEELSRSLRRRLASTQPATLRAVAVVSRISLRDPYAPGADLTGDPRRVRPTRRRRREAVDATAS